MAEERFHIAEWYGQPFHTMTDEERLRLARHQVGGAAMKKAEINRLLELEEKALKAPLKPTEEKRLSKLRGLLERQRAEELACPFRTDSSYATCTKPGGVCSIRLYSDTNGGITPLHGERGRIRSLCPWRFHQDKTAFRKVSERLLDDPNPIFAGEVGFLESSGNLDSKAGKDVGRIDMILVKSGLSGNTPMQWVAVEVQAVYFSGKKMQLEFDELVANSGALKMPVEKRRPDYRSSGVKRLMPQLQIKVPTLRRWGKKMAVIVDAPFYYSMGKMSETSDVSNADIIWFLVDFLEDASDGKYKLAVVEEHYTTLESATLGLTGGDAVTQKEFEERITGKIGR